MRPPLLVLLVLLLVSTCAPAGEDATTTAGDEEPVAIPATEDRDGDEPGEAEPAADAEAPAAPAPDLLALPADGPPVAPRDPVALAAVVTAAEQTIRDPQRAADELDAAGHWQQVAYRKLGDEPALRDPVLAEVPAELHPAVRANLFADERLAAMHGPADPNKPVRELPAWRIVAPPPADELKSYYEEAQAATGVHWTYLAAVNLVETRMGRIRGDSVAGAQGPMQFMPATWAEWGEGDVTDHRDAIMAAARYLRWGGMPGDVNGALFRYNRDVRYVDAVRTYAEQMQADPRAYYGYYHWQVYFYNRADHVWLAPGYDGTGG